MSKSNFFIQLANKVQFELFGNFLTGNGIVLQTADAGTLQYRCALDDYQMAVARTQFKSTIIEVED